MYKSLDDIKKALTDLVQGARIIEDQYLRKTVYEHMIMAFSVGTLGMKINLNFDNAPEISQGNKEAMIQVMEKTADVGSKARDYIENHSLSPAKESEEIGAFFVSLSGGDVEGYKKYNRDRKLSPVASKALDIEENEV